MGHGEADIIITGTGEDWAAVGAAASRTKVMNEVGRFGDDELRDAEQRAKRHAHRAAARARTRVDAAEAYA